MTDKGESVLKVYVIQYHDYNDPCDVYGVYDTRKKAEQVMKDNKLNAEFYDISEYSVEGDNK